MLLASVCDVRLLYLLMKVAVNWGIVEASIGCSSQIYLDVLCGEEERRGDC